jgi:hypothetical protein
VRAIITMPCPKAQEEIRVFLGLTGFYRKHIDGYARIVTPLTDLLNKGVNVVKDWTPQHTEAVETLKKAITQYPILANSIHNGASSYAPMLALLL